MSYLQQKLEVHRIIADEIAIRGYIPYGDSLYGAIKNRIRDAHSNGGGRYFAEPFATGERKRKRPKDTGRARDRFFRGEPGASRFLVRKANGDNCSAQAEAIRSGMDDILLQRAQRSDVWKFGFSAAYISGCVVYTQKCIFRVHLVADYGAAGGGGI